MKINHLGERMYLLGRSRAMAEPLLCSARKFGLDPVAPLLSQTTIHRSPELFMTAKILAVLLLFALPIQAKTRIEAAYAAGELDLETALIYQVLSVRAPDQLPAIYRESGGLAVCGTPHLVQAMSAAPNLSADFQARLAKLVKNRPDAQHSLLSPSGHFRVHYDTAGVNAVSSRGRLTPTASRTTSTARSPSSTALGCSKSSNSATIHPLRTTAWAAEANTTFMLSS